MKSLFPLFAFSLIFLASCVKDTPQFEVVKAPVSIQFEHKLNDSEFNYSTNFTNDLGQTIRLTRASIYFSKPAIDSASFSETYGFITPDSTTWYLGELYGGDYASIKFDAGIDAATNHADVALLPLGHPLGFQTPSTHWNWSLGYLWLILEGEVDSDNDGTPDQGFIYHIGKDELLKHLAYNQTISVTSEDPIEIDITIDWAKFLDGIDVIANPVTHTNDNLPLATDLMNNSSSAISIN